MDKSDIEMEDAEKKAQDVDATAVVESEGAAAAAAVDGEQQSAVSLVESQEGAKAEDEDQNNHSEEIGAKSSVPAENGNGEQTTASNTVEGERNVTDETADQTDSKGVVEDLSDANGKVDDQTNAATETANQSDTVSQPETQGNTAGGTEREALGEDNATGGTEGEALGKDNATGGTEGEEQVEDNDTAGTGGEALGEDKATAGTGGEALGEDKATGGTEGEIKIEKKEGDLDADVAVKSEVPVGNAEDHDTNRGNLQVHEELPANEVGESEKEASQAENLIKEIHQNGNDMMVDEQKDVLHKTNTAPVITDGDARLGGLPESKDVNRTAIVKMPEPATPIAMKSATAKVGLHTTDDEDEDEDWNDDGSPVDQAAFMRELESFYKERAMEFKPPKFYGHQLNCLKLWRSVIRLGGYDRVTGSKLWRQVGESFNPPKTCTTVSWTFRIFYEKALLEYERHKVQSGELALPIVSLADAGVDNEGNGSQAPGSGRARRDAAARAMQGWHEQRLLGYGEDKNGSNMPKREKNLKSIGSLKHKRPNEMEHPVKAARTETFKQLVTTVVDLGPPADWVKINVRETKDCFEVYALVPGLLREEVRVQSDPVGRLVITGQPEQLDNPWGITAFKKVISLPARIDPLQTSAVVSLHGRLYVRVPFAH